MSDLPKNLWHDGWTQADWDRHEKRRRRVWIAFAVAVAVSVAALLIPHV